MNRISLREDIQPLSEFRSHVAAFIQQVRENHRPLLITHRGKSAAVLLDVGQYEEMLDKLELMNEVRTAEEQVDAGRGISHEKVKERVLRSLKR